MTIKTHLNSIRALLAVFGFALIVFAGAVSFAGASSPFDIEFPIPELGNCANQTECRAYCDEDAHEQACRAFAAKHGLGDDSEDRDNDHEHDDKFAVILEDGGPGACARGADNPRASCETYCNASGHMRECVLYAERHNLMDADELEEAKKVIGALDSGVPLPAACTDLESCKDVCENPKDVGVMRQCFAFARAAGLLPDDVDASRAEAMFKAIEEGRAPFRSPKDFEQCENPSSDAVFEKCIAFALESGLIPEKEAEMIRKTGGRGPGGCRGERECRAYCENEGNREACISFAVEHDLLSPEDKQRIEEGKEEARRALTSAPPEVLSCIEEEIGAEKLAQIKRGEGFFGPELGEIFPRCFDKVLGNQEHGGSFGQGVPPEAVGCFRELFGDDFEARLRAGEIDPGEHDNDIRACLERQFGEGFLNDRGEYEHPERGTPSPSDGNRPDEMHSLPFDPSRPPTPEEIERYRMEYPEQFKEEYRQRFEEQYREQYEEQYRDEYQKQYEEYRQEYNTPPPSSDGTAPSSLRGRLRQAASALGAFLGLLPSGN